MFLFNTSWSKSVKKNKTKQDGVQIIELQVFTILLKAFTSIQPSYMTSYTHTPTSLLFFFTVMDVE